MLKNTAPLRISFLSAVSHIFGWAVVPLAAAVLLSMTAAGEHINLRVMLSAFLIVFAVMLCSAAVVVKVSARGAAWAAYVFLVGGILRMFAVIGLSAAAWKMFDFPHVQVLLWAVVMYTASLIGEIIWLGRALKKHGLHNPPDVM